MNTCDIYSENMPKNSLYVTRQPFHSVCTVPQNMFILADCRIFRGLCLRKERAAGRNFPSI